MPTSIRHLNAFIETDVDRFMANQVLQIVNVVQLVQVVVRAWLIRIYVTYKVYFTMFILALYREDKAWSLSIVVFFNINFTSKWLNDLFTDIKAKTNTRSIHLSCGLKFAEQCKKFFFVFVFYAYTCIFDRYF